MSSRRKSTTPCMVPPREEPAPHFDQEMENVVMDEELNLFTVHVSTEHPDVVITTSYVCMEELRDNFTRTMVRQHNETVIQQTVNDLTFDGSFVKMEDDEESEEMWRRGIVLSKTPIMRVRGRQEVKKFTATQKMAATDNGGVIKVESDEEDEDEQREPPTLSPAPLTPAVATATVAPRLVPVSAPLQVQAVPQGIVVNRALAQVLTALQQQQQQQQNGTQTQLLIPVSSIPTYNAAMDSNVLLHSAYNRFPYPSVSEIMGLVSQTKFTEEQIKVWFSAQRLKHGVSWTPEEVEEARKKKFNGTVQAVPQTITVIPANIAAATNGLQSIFQTCQIVGQPGLVLTQVTGNGTALPVASPITLTVAGVPGNQPKAAEPSTSESTAELTGSSASLALGLDTLGSKPKKSKEQLAELKASYSRRQFATEAEISRLMQVTKLSKRAIKKWFSDTRYNQRNSRDQHSLLDSSPTTASAPGTGGNSRVKFRHAFPDFTPQKFKEKTPEQLLVLEASFQKSDTPSDEELSRLRTETKLTRREVDAWFTERRKAPTTKEGGDVEKAFVHTQWPTPEEYDRMANESGLPRTYVVNWFGDTRYACKNSNLKWYYLYQSGKALNGGAKKKSRKRNRGWSKRTRRPNASKRSPKEGVTAIKVKSGKSFLKDYYLKHGILSEKDLDELVMKSSMSYEQVRDWFAETAKRKEEGQEPFSEEEEAEEDEEEEEEEGEDEEEEEEETTVGTEQEDGEGDMEVKEQGDEASDDGKEEEKEEEKEQEEIQEEAE
uniref:Zinc fingers and homeoboxes protein 1 n=1 Tax=Cynoglossus semilaevis TaxID=244447 RepID=A0A3P8WXT1_CYNSE